MEKKKSKVVFEEHPLPDARPIYYTTPDPQPDEKSFNNAHLATLFAGIVIGVLVMIVIAGTLYLNKINEDDVASINLPVVVSPVPTKMVTPSPLSPTINTASWNTYSDGTYSFKYPQDWIADTTYFNEKYGYHVTVYNSQKTVGLRILSKPFVYSLSLEDYKDEDLRVVIDDVISETIQFGNIRRDFVEFRIVKNNKEYQVLFGTNLPESERTTTESLEDYEKEKSTILSILSTLKIQ